MNLLLDTHALVWMVAQPERLSDEAQQQVRDPANLVLVSSVSPWELAIKAGLNRELGIPANLAEWLPEVLKDSGLELLPLELRHVLAVEHLPQHHRDPFDRALIAHAQVEQLTIVTADRTFDRYGVSILRA